MATQLERIDREICIRSFRAFVERAWQHVGLPDRVFVPGRHIDIMCDRLQAAAEGRTRSLLFNLPPRCSKSTLLLLWQAWTWAGHERCRRLLWGPSIQFLRCSYDEQLVHRDSARCRRLIRSAWYRDLTEGRVEIREDRGQLGEWELTGGGGLISVTLRGAITGRDSHVQIIDDPHSVFRVERASERDDVKVAFREVLPSRVNDPARLVKVVAAQRTHVDDLSADILAGDADGEWEHVCLPAHFDPAHPHLYRHDRRAPGELLWPERFDDHGLATISRDMTLYAKAAQLEQRPEARGAGLFKDARWEFVDTYPKRMRLVRFWDLAGTEPDKTTADPDWTVGTLAGHKDGIDYLIDQVAFRGGPAEVERRVKQTAEIDGHEVEICIEREPAASGKIAIDHFRRNVLSGYAVRDERAGGDPILRVNPLCASAEAGNVWLVRGSWNREFLDEVALYPGGAHDDRVISAAGAKNRATALASHGPVLDPISMHRQSPVRIS